MPEVTLEAIAGLIQSELKDQLDPIKSDISTIKETLGSHTTALVELAKDVKEIRDELAVVNQKTNKHDQAIRVTAEKVGIQNEVTTILQS